MYTTRRRWGDYVSFRSLAAGRDIHFSVPLFVEGVYSWRTGSNSVSDPPVVPPVRTTDPFGLHMPSNKGNLVEQLAERKKYTEDLLRTAFPAETQTGSLSTNRISTTDSGHLFVSHKTLRKPYRGYLDRLDPKFSGGVLGDSWQCVDEGVSNLSPFPLGLPGENKGDSLGLTSTQRQAVANRYFAATAPDRNDATLAVTVLELLRGDLPSLLKNYRNMAAGYKNLRNTLGSDALNIMFGWTPLIQEYANVIKVGLTLDRAIYYESFRRKRQWDGPSARTTASNTIAMGSLGSAYSSGGFLPGDVGGISSGIAVTYNQNRTIVESEDYHFSSKYAGLAKPTRKADYHMDQAVEIIKRMGLIDDPTLMWDLTPWSWLVDWFTTMGDSISNAAIYSPMTGRYSVDYAYLTTQRIRKVDGELTTPVTNLSSYRKALLIERNSFAYSTTRWRDRATPFGFGTQLGSLSASQFAVLVALGFAKTR